MLGDKETVISDPLREIHFIYNFRNVVYCIDWYTNEDKKKITSNTLELYKENWKVTRTGI